MLLIPYHAAMAWNIWGEPNYIFFESNNMISSIVVFFSPYFMPSLFLIAGMCARFSLQKRTVKQYVLERFQKLLIPFVFGVLLTMPLMTYIADKFNCGYEGNFFQHYSIFFTKFTDLTGADGGFSVGQFWFVLYLFFISVIAVMIVTLQKRMIPQCKKDIPLSLVCLLGLPLLFLSDLLSIGQKSLAEYTYLFLVGYYVFANDNMTDKIEKYKYHFLCIGLTATVLNVYMFIWADTNYPLFHTIIPFISEWFMIIALIGIGKKHLDFSRKASRYMSHISFAFYILHFIWVVLFQFLLYDICGNNTLLLYIAPVLLAYCMTFLCCAICIRIPLFCFFMGTKPIHHHASDFNE